MAMRGKTSISWKDDMVGPGAARAAHDLLDDAADCEKGSGGESHNTDGVPDNYED
jgi:hypothetical protein